MSAPDIEGLIAAALMRLRFLNELTMGWDVSRAEVNEDTLSGIGLVIDEVIDRVEKIEALELGVRS